MVWDDDVPYEEKNARPGPGGLNPGVLLMLLGLVVLFVAMLAHQPNVPPPNLPPSSQHHGAQYELPRDETRPGPSPSPLGPEQVTPLPAQSEPVPPTGAPLSLSKLVLLLRHDLDQFKDRALYVIGTVTFVGSADDDILLQRGLHLPSAIHGFVLSEGTDLLFVDARRVAHLPTVCEQVKVKATVRVHLPPAEEQLPPLAYLEAWSWSPVDE